MNMRSRSRVISPSAALTAASSSFFNSGFLPVSGSFSPLASLRISSPSRGSRGIGCMSSRNFSCLPIR